MTAPISTDTPHAGVLADVQSASFRSLLDFARWTAAFVVFASHLRNHIHVKHSGISPSADGWLVQVWYLISGLHWEAVSVFFVLSGFLVGGITTARARIGQFHLPSYSINRATRIYIAFAPAVILGWALDSIIVNSGAGLGIYEHLHPLVKGPSQHVYANQLSGDVLYSNLLMLQSFYVKPVGSNLPLWTLSFEFWFYVLFGCGVVMVVGNSWIRRLVALLVAGSTIFFMGGRLPALMLLWLLGLVAALPGAQFLRRPGLALLTLFGLLVAARLHDYQTQPSAIAYYVMEVAPAVAFAWLVFSARGHHYPWLIRLQPLNQWLASFSFSLYLVHYPVMLALIVALGQLGVEGLRVGYQPNDLTGIAVYLGVFAAVVIFSYGFALLTERQTGRIRALITSQLPGALRKRR